MSDTMPCQMCLNNGKSGEAYTNFNDRGVYVATCVLCGISGPIVDSEAMERAGVEDHVYGTFGDHAERLASSLWNEMQTYIARGKLLDAAPPPTRARL